MNDKKETKEEKALVKTGIKTKADIVLSKDTVKRFICKDATDAELELFVYQCLLFNLNPFKREIYLIKYSQLEAAQAVIAYTEFIKRAEDQKELKGWKAWTEPEGAAVPVKACIKIWKQGWDEPFYWEVFFDEFAKYKKAGDGSEVLTKFWKKMPKGQLKKVVIKQGFSLCWPKQLSALPPIQEELDITIDVEAIPVKSEEKELPAAAEKMTIRKPAQEKEAVPIKKTVTEAKPEKKKEEHKEPAAIAPDEKTKEEKAAEGYSQKADLVELIKKYLQEKTIDLKKFKAWLGEVFQPEKEVAHKHFKIVDINEHGAWSLNAGEPESLKLCHQHLDFLIEKYIEYEKEKPEQEEIPF